MELDIDEFNIRLNQEIAKGNRDIAGYILREIRAAESMKTHLMEEMNDETKDFLSSASAKLDTYVFQLQEKEKALNPLSLSLDQRTALNDKGVRNEMSKRIEELDTLNPKPRAEDNLPDPEKI